ncbi:hypothetical protein HOP62_08620 [Halomonas sp. MCCC 1A17488]|uniref:hypothetical protein n=1 Tax=unclassified Halomonas TaxID=2609666 RepID=UPI0018D26B81|nr:MULTISPECIES: hypothetical protein [unclassified Halomonas]MCE8016138.1 hypothetical protein [Halomonas sp. MCCC 1A17488]MCG3239471.1 hypothetical protein [Halomonas sp. MCCC 1A17488]QPP50604.1 hypothetical protein I4484_05760 [Halomonas sp. SS10-MC5]
MPVFTTIEFPGVTETTYESLGASLASKGAPVGILYHACGAVSGGWRIVDVWRSAEDFDRFVDGTLLPAARALGLPEPARRECFPAHHAGQVVS